MIYTLYLSSLIASATIAVALAYFFWQRRSKPGAIAMLLVVLAAAIMSLGYVLQYTSASLSTQIFAGNIQYIGIMALPVMWVVFSLQYTDHSKWLTRRNLLLLSIVPFATVVIVWTNGIDGLMYHGRHLDTSGPFVIIAKTYGPWFWIAAANNYLLMLCGMFFLLQRLFRPPRLYRQQSIALAIAVIVPLACNIVYIFNLTPSYHVDLTPSAFVISGLAIAWGLFRVRLFDVIPIARSAIVESMSDGIIVLDTEDRFVDLNRAAERIVGRIPSEVIGQPVTDVLSEQPKLVELLSIIGVSEKQLETEVEKGETSRYYNLNTSPLYDRRGQLTGRLIVLTDITERKRLEEEARSSKKRLEDVVESMTDGVTITDMNGVITDINHATVLQSGYIKEELVGKMLGEILMVKQEFPKFVKAVEALNSGKTVRDEEYTSKHKDGRTFPISVSLSVLRNIKGEPTAIIAVHRDITERRKAEEKERRLQEELYLTSRLATVGEMSAGIAHEINNPLTVVVGFSSLLSEKDLPEDIKKDVGIIHDGAKRIASITERMLAFARQRKPGRSSVNINDIIETTLTMRTHEMESSNIKVTTQLDPDIPLTYADAGQLQQVFLNIILNAEMEMKLAHDKGNLTVKTGRIDNTIRVSFKDDGPGITKKNLDRLFDPFFTTRDPDKGTGLGLSICYSIVTQHDGKIYAHSRLGRGATFFIELPIVKLDLTP